MKIMKRIYTLMIMTLLLCTIAVGYAQQVNLNGRVVDPSGEPLVGVTILIKGTSNGAVTDYDGYYKLAAQKSSMLEISSIGYKSILVAVGERTTINITMEEQAQALDDVVVVGYGTLRKSDLTGAVSSVNSEVFADADGSSFMSALSGKVTGVQVTQNSGVPGGTTTIKIRGSNSMGSSEPLYVIDGVPYDNSSVNGFENDGAAISPISMINPADIESMEILKDASATAIYGSQASNGVVLITTKSGSAGKATVSANFEYGISELTQRIDLLDANQFTIIKNEAQLNAGSGGVDSKELMAANMGLLKTTDWQDVLFTQGQTMSGNVSITGGTNKIKYMASLNAYQGSGVVPETDFTRFTGRVNATFEITSKLTLGLNITMASVKTNGLPASTNLGEGDSTGLGSVITSALRTNPTLSADGLSANIYDPEDVDGFENQTPLQTINATTQENNLFLVTTNTFLQAKLSKYLNFRASINYSNRSNTANFYQSREIKAGYTCGGWARIRESESTNIVNDYLLSYNRQFNRIHRLNLVAGSTIQVNNSEWQQVSVKGFPNDKLMWYDLSAGTNIEPTTNGNTDVQSISWYWRANYSLTDRYVFTFTARVDGSSKFSDGNKFGFFPAGAFAWRINQEKWMKSIKDISNLKLRISYGVTGNQNLSPYSSLILMTSEYVNLGGSDSEDISVGYSFSQQMANEEVKWETTRQFNGGLDVGLFKNRLEITADYYHKDTDDLLVNVQTENFTGYTTSIMNFGRMRNQGFELGINGTIFDKKKFSWNSSFNISFNKTVITELEQDYYSSGVSLPWGSQYTQMLIEGEELGTFWGYQRDGILQTGETASYKFADGSSPEAGEQLYVDTDGNGILDESDKQIIGQAQPDFVFGINNTFNFYNFDFTFYIDGSVGNDICDMNSIQGLAFNNTIGYAEVWERWTEDNPSDVYPRVDSNNNSSSFVFSDRYLSKGSYIRLQRVTLGYTLPGKLTSKVKIRKARVYASASNILTITKYSGYSPDISYGGSNNLLMGHDSGSYPSPLTITAGLNLTF